jgi:putative oxidoreductase
MFRFFQKYSHVSVFFLRMGVAMIFVYHGYNKLFGPGAPQKMIDYLTKIGFPFPVGCAYLAGGVEFFGGIMIGLGLLTRQASFGVIIVMLVAVFFVHRGDPYREMEHAVQMLVLSIGTLYSGSGSFSLENLVKKHGD